MLSFVLLCNALQLFQSKLRVNQQSRLQYLIIYGFPQNNEMFYNNKQKDLLGFPDIFTGGIDSIVYIANN
jgi:hypothetical protein